MSRIGKLPITIPAGTDVAVADGVISVKGKGGTLTQNLHQAVEVTVADGIVTVAPANNSSMANALWGTFASIVRSMVVGVNEPFCKKLNVEGVGYKVDLTGKDLKLNVGFSHPVVLTVPEELEVKVEKNEISICGASKHQVGQFAANVRAVKPPEPYKGKGIRYSDENVRRKQGKKSS